MDYERRQSGLLVPESKIKFKGKYIVQHWRPDPKVKGWRELVAAFEIDNIVTNQGLDYILAAGLTGGSAIAQWYLGLYKGNYSPVGTDTAATFPGNSQESTSYGPNRVGFTGVEGSQNAGNSAQPATFNFTATDTIYGAFLISSQAVGSTQGILFSATTFPQVRNVLNGDALTIVYGVAGTSG